MASLFLVKSNIEPTFPDGEVMSAQWHTAEEISRLVNTAENCTPWLISDWKFYIQQKNKCFLPTFKLTHCYRKILTMNHSINESYQEGTSQRESKTLKISNLFDLENKAVDVVVEMMGDEIIHFWLENSSENKIDILSLLPSRERILAKASTLNRFSAAIDDYSKAVLEWQHKQQYSTEDVLAFIHELGHAMDGVQITASKFLLRVKAQSPTTTDEAKFFIQDEEKAQANARKILQLLIRKKILLGTPDLNLLIDNWDKEYQQRIRTKVSHLTHDAEISMVA